MVRHPLVLRAEIGLDIGGVAAVLVGRGEQVLLPDDAVGLGEVFAEAGIARAAPRDLRFDLARLVLLPDLLLVLQRGGGDGAELAFVGHVALHRRQQLASRRSLRIWRTGCASATPIASSVQPSATSRSMARH